MRAEIKTGARPWLPSPSAVMSQVLDKYNYPLAGLFEQDGSGDQILFVCAVGEEDDTNVWLYAPVSTDEVAALEESEGDDTIRQIMLALRNKRVECALAFDYEIVRSGWVDTGSEDPGVSVRRFLGDVERQMEREQQGIRGLENDLDTDDNRHSLASA